MKRLLRLRTGILATIAALLATVLVGPVAVQAEGAGNEDDVLVDLRIWQNVRDAEDIWVSARLAGGDWNDVGTFLFQFDEDEGGGFFWPHFLYRDGRLAVGDVVLAVTQDIRELDLIYASTCSYPPSCGLIRVPLDDGHSRGGRFRYGDITLAVPVRREPPADDERLLIEDRDHLLALRDRLAGYERTLNWHPAVPIEHWTGVTVAGTPPRVTSLHLSGGDLRGGLSGLLGDLTGLTELRLDGNRLDSSIPSKLLQLENLIHLYLGGNQLEGCIPPPLLAIPNNDLQSLELPGCPPLLDISYDEHILVQGTYRLGNIVFDLPRGTRLKVDGYVINEGDADAYILSSMLLGGWIAIQTDATTYGPTPGAAFDRIRESVWVATDEELSRWEGLVGEDSAGNLPVLSATPRTYPRLSVLWDGAPDALILEWVGGPSSALGWQYRHTIPEGDDRRWGDWTDISGSDSSTRSHRVEGLQSGHDYLFQVRAVETLEGLPSPGVEQSFLVKEGIPLMRDAQVVVGDGVTEWRLPASNLVITIPEEVRLRARVWPENRVAVAEASGATALVLDRESGEEVRRSYSSRSSDSDNALLDQILASLRQAPRSAP